MFPRPRACGISCGWDISAGACSGCSAGAQQTLIVWWEKPGVKDCQTHYWALRQQARDLFVPSVGNRRWC